MTHKLKILFQISSINFIVLAFLSFNLAHANINSCNFFSNENLQLKNSSYPKLIEIDIPNSKKWMMRTLKSINEDRINKRYKKYQKAKFKITYPNNVKCEYSGKIRIHGGRVDHVDVDKLNSSVRIILEDGHINNKYNFALLKKNTISFDDEIFATTFFEKMGYLSGLNYITKIKVNNSEAENYLFREIPTLEMAKDNKRNNGIFLQANKNELSKHKTSPPYSRSVILNRIKNFDGIAENNANTLLYALDKLNYLYLNSLGIGNGKECCKDKLNKKNSLIKKHYNKGIYSLNFSKLNDEIEIEKNSIFNLLMNATNSTHGLALEDRGFFYDPTFDRLEPFYRDGNTNIVYQNNFDYEVVQLFKFEKKYIDKTIKMINEINIDDFQKILLKKGLELDKLTLNEIFNRIISNLNKIKNLELYDNHKNDFTKNYFSNHFDNDLKFNLAFGGLNNKFEICDIHLLKCKNVNIEKEDKYILLKDKWLNLEKFNKPILYVRLSKENYSLNLKPTYRGLKKFKTLKVDDDFIIYYNSQNKGIILDKNNKEIILKQHKISDKFVFTGSNIKNWDIKFYGSKNNLKKTTMHKRDENMIGGCVAFINSKFDNINIEILNNTCSKGIEVLNSQGSFNKIFITKSKLDAFDAELSTISINKILIHGAIGECIGLKRGKYKIYGAIVKNCLDHSVSVGEHAELIIHKVVVNNSSGKYRKARYRVNGIMAKDSSKITLLEYKNINSRQCLLSLRKKNYYDGSVIKVKKEKFECNVNRFTKDKYSLIEFF